jgi:replicative DNA helicase
MDIASIIMQKIDLAEFIRTYAKADLTRVSNGWRCKCPIHGSDNQSSMYISDTGLYCCYSCNSAGNVINFLSDFEHISYTAALERLAAYLNINLKDDESYQKCKSVEQAMTSKKEYGIKNLYKVEEYLKQKRGFTDETINAFGLGGVDGGVCIPLHDANGRCVAIAKRQFDKKPKYINSYNNELYDKSAFLFNLDKAFKLINDRIYVVEGYMDAISGYQMGLPVVAYCGNELHRDQIKTLTRYLKKDVTIILVPDNDEEGMKRVPRVRDYFNAICPDRQVRVALVPDSCKDMNDMLLEGIDPSKLETLHIDRYVIDYLVGKCSTEEEKYHVVEEYLPTVRSGLIRLDIIKEMAKKWDKDYETLKEYFDTVGKDSDDILAEASDVTGCINDLKSIYRTGGFPTHFQQIDNCIRRVEKKQVIVVGATAGTGKALTLDTRIITPTGYKEMKNINIGDEVIDENGDVCHVKAIFPQGKKHVYRVVFEDGTYVNCCSEHLWKFKTKDDLVKGRKWKVMSLKDMVVNYKIHRTDGTKNLCIPVAKAVEFDNREHVIPPYTMGALLGDGGFTCKQITFTNPEKDIRSHVITETSAYGTWHEHKGQPNQLCFRGGRNNKLVNYIRKTFNGASSKDKFIPFEYMNDSIKNRMELLKGLIDTDGTVRKRGQTLFFTSSPRLANDVAELVRSLGSRCYIRSLMNDDGTFEYTVSIQRKSSKWFSSELRNKQWNEKDEVVAERNSDVLLISDIIDLGREEEMQCITVDSPEHTYLCGDYIVTHNTDFAIEFMLRAICQNNMRAIFFSLEMPKGKLIERVVAKLIGCSIGEVEGYVASDDMMVNKAIAKLQERMLVFDGNHLSIDDINERIKLVNSKNVLGGPVDIVFVDYFGYMQGTSTFEDASTAAKKMKGMAKDNNIIFVMLSQLNRGASTYDEPTMSQLKSTGDLEASADYVFLLWRPARDPNLDIGEKEELENITRLKIDKARDGMYGPNLAEFRYDKETSRLEENYA